MTVSATDSFVYREGNGVATTFPFSFRADSVETVYVDLIYADGSTRPLLVSEYTVELSGVGGNVTTQLSEPIAVDQRLYIWRDTPIEQEVSIGQQVGYNPAVVESVWDRLTMSLQELAGKLKLTMSLPPGSDESLTIEQLLAASSAAEAAAIAAANSAASAAAKENSMLRWRGAWQTGVAYAPSDIVHATGSSYVCLVAHTAGTGEDWLTVWGLFAAQGAAGAGTGDMLKSENLSGLTDVSMARANLGLPQLLCQTGMVVAFAGATAPQGWIACAGQTIGNAASGATYANADAQALFAHMWSQFDNTLLPILDSAGAASVRGANAAADWSANKRLPILDLRGEFVRGLDASRGVDSGRALGTAQGDANKAHNHSVTDPGHTHSVTTGSRATDNPMTTRVERSGTVNNSAQNIANAAVSATTGITIGNSGGDEARPRNVALLYCIKL